MATRRARPPLRALALVVVVSLLAACGIDGEDSPREIPGDALPPSLQDATVPTTTTISEPGRSRLETVYLVNSDRSAGADTLEPVVIEVAETGSADDLPRRVVEALVAARPDALERPELLNAIPPDTEVLRADLGDDHVLDLDLTDLDTVEGTLQRLAVAQLVFTLTELASPRIDGVRFSVDGQPVAVPAERGTVPAGQPVTRADDQALLDSLQARTPTR